MKIGVVLLIPGGVQFFRTLVFAKMRNRGRLIAPACNGAPPEAQY